MTEEYIISKGWEKSTWINGHVGYIHKKWNLTDDQFYVEMKVFGNDVQIVEENDRGDTEQVFTGILKTNDDLDAIMRLLYYDFDDKM